MNRFLRPALGLATSVSLVAVSMMAISAGTALGSRAAPHNGRIAISRFVPSLNDTVLYTVNPDGSHLRQLLRFPLECPHWSPDGRRIATCGGPNGSASVIINVDNHRYRELPSADPTLFTGCPVWSADGRRLACEGFGKNDPSRNGIYTIRSSDGRDLRRVTRNPGGDDQPGSYSPNNRRIVFSRLDANGNPVGLFTITANGGSLRRLTSAGALVSSPGDWSLQGNRIVFSMHPTADAHSSIWIVRANGRGLHRVHIGGLFCGGLIDNPAAVGCTNPQWSPNGRKIVFVSNDTGYVYTVNASGNGLHRVTRGNDFVDWGVHPLTQ